MTATSPRVKNASGLFATASPEFLFVAACCLWPATPQEVLESHARNVTDWSRVVRLAERHRVAGLVHRCFSALENIPLPVREDLQQKAGRIARGNLCSLAVLRRVSLQLRESGTPFLLMKGLAVSQLAYGDLSVRHSRDIDLLVAPEHVEAAEEQLLRLGWTADASLHGLTPLQQRKWRSVRKHHEYTDPLSGTRLELHWRAHDNAHLPSERGHGTQPVLLAPGFRVETPGGEELLRQLLIHGACHAWFRLKWLADVAVLRTHLAEERVAALRAEMRAAGLDRLWDQATLLCDALQANAGMAVASAEPIRNRVSLSLAEIARDALLQEDVARPSAEADFVPRRLLWSRMLLSRSWRYRWAELRLHLASPKDWTTLRVPASLHFLYPVLRIPLWVRRRFRSRSQASLPRALRSAK